MVFQRNPLTSGNGDSRIHKSPTAPYQRILLVNPCMDAIGAEFMMEDVPLRLEYLAAYVRPHVEAVEVADLIKEGKPLSYYLEHFQPDLVGVTLNYISTHRTSLLLAEEAKQYGADVVFGGYLATALDKDFALDPNVDYVVRGEGEQTLLELIERRPLDEVLGITFARDGEVVETGHRPNIEDLDQLPFPERNRRKYHYNLPFADLEPDENTAYEMIITSRGCWGRCNFCTEPMMSQGKQRYRSAENVIAEIEELVALHEGKRLRLLIADPNFGGSLRKTHEIMDALVEFRKRSTAQVNLFVTVRTSTVANHPDLVRKFGEAGVDYVFVGMESPSKEVLKAIGKGGGAQEKQERAVQLLRENGAATMSCFLLGLPGQTEKDVFELLDYARSMELEDAYFAVVCPLPGSKLYNEHMERGDLIEPDHRKWKLYDLVTPHDHFTPAKMKELCIRCNSKWYDDLMLPQAWRRFEASGRRKRRLHQYASRFTALVGFFAFLGENDEELSDLDPYALVQEMPNPGLRQFTETHPLHEMFEMRRFLRLLGDQVVQVTLAFSEGREVSWVLKAEGGRVRYLDCIDGHAEDATVTIRVPMESGSPTPADMVRGILAAHASPRSALHLARLVAATSDEISAFLATRTRARVRHTVADAWRSAMRRLTRTPRSRRGANGNGNGNGKHHSTSKDLPVVPDGPAPHETEPAIYARL